MAILVHRQHVREVPLGRREHHTEPLVALALGHFEPAVIQERFRVGEVIEHHHPLKVAQGVVRVGSGPSRVALERPHHLGHADHPHLPHVPMHQTRLEVRGLPQETEKLGAMVRFQRAPHAYSKLNIGRCEHGGFELLEELGDFAAVAELHEEEVGEELGLVTEGGGMGVLEGLVGVVAVQGLELG